MTLNSAISELTAGQCGAFFIDDTGSPGLADTPAHLHRQRKSWVAVYVDEDQIREVMDQFPGALAELEERVGAKEFHSIDIFQGKKAFEGVPFEVRMLYFEFMVDIFRLYRFPILMQTFHPDSELVQLSRAAFPNGVGPFDMGNHEDVALLLLIFRAKWMLQRENGKPRARLFLDEGRFKAGSAIKIPRLDPPFVRGEIISAASCVLHPLQLADFAAFAMNRTQLLLGRLTLNERDKHLLTILSGLQDNYRNITFIQGQVDQWPPLSQDALVALLNSKPSRT